MQPFTVVVRPFHL